MALDLSSEQSAIFDLARDFGADKIGPNALAWEKDGTIPKALWGELAELGFGGLYVSEDAGGSGLSRHDATLVFEALAMACPSVSAFLSIHNMVAWMLDTWGGDALKERMLPKAVSMESFLAYCLTEPGSGSDAAALKTRAARSNEGWRLTGTKAFISGGGYADAFLVMCRTGEDGPRGISAILVEDGAPGLSFGGLEDKMGWRAQPTRQVQLDDCPVPAENLLGEEGHGFRYAMAGLDGGRLNIAACSLGAAQAALNMTLSYMAERKAFGKTIDQFQALQFRLADMEIELAAARTLLRDAAKALDEKAHDATKRCAMAKKFVTETGSKVADGCLQLHGGYGYLADYGIEKIVRDLRVHQILEGTNEIMRLIVARDMLAGRG
ncbi:MAG: acyl-CoA dehydrogenase family protein [Pseudomonadota bacterium]